jgi:hypothetical protein
MSGFSIIKADSMEDALAIAQACPFLEIGGLLLFTGGPGGAEFYL